MSGNTIEKCCVFIVEKDGKKQDTEIISSVQSEELDQKSIKIFSFYCKELEEILQK